MSSLVVARHLAQDFGIVSLPSSFFAMATDAQDGLSDEGADCIRFSVANVTDEKIRLLGKRLEKVYEALGKTVRG